MKIVGYIVAVVFVLGLGYVFLFAAARADRGFNTVATPPPYPAAPAAQQLHDTLRVVDLHADALLWPRDLNTRHDYGHVDVPRLVEGNVAVQVFAAVTKSPSGQNFERNTGDSDRITALVAASRWPLRTWGSLAERALYQAEKLHDMAARSEGQLTVVRSRSDLDAFLARRATTPGLVAGLLAIEGLHAMEGDLANLDRFYAAGYRMMALTHFFDIDLGGSAHGVARGGLTDLGREVIRWQQAHGVIIDLAHVAPRAIDDILALATSPVVVSHTGVQATCPGPRNLTDDQLVRIAATDGVVGIGFWAGAVCDPTVEAIVRAMRHVADLIGVRHLALGSDFDGTIHAPFDTRALPQLTEALLADGFSPADIAAIMGENALRVFRQVLPEG